MRLAMLAVVGLAAATDESLWPRASNDSNAIAAMLPMYPACAQPCIATALANSPCLDTRCICMDQEYRRQVRTCVKASCRIREAMQSKNRTEHACQRPRRDKTSSFTAMSISIAAVAYVIVAARLIFKQFFSQGRRLGVDDWLVLAGAVAGICCTVINVRGLSRHGLGKDVWTLEAETISDFKLDFYLVALFYIIMTIVAKAAINFFYLSIFPGERTRLLLWCTAVFILSFGMASLLVGIFQCRPVAFYWKMYRPKQDAKAGSCVNIHVATYVNGGINIALNIWLIMVPLVIIGKLELHWKKKLGVIIMFLIGVFDTVVSILRLRSIVHFGNSWNPTWDQFDIAWWSVIETNVALICSSLPTMRLILVLVFPRVFSTIRNKTASTTSSSTVPRKNGSVDKNAPRMTTMSLDIIEAQNVPRDEYEDDDQATNNNHEKASQAEDGRNSLSIEIANTR
ncbi:hypothetical protein CDD80_1695 [Ophiocordyceps camponoti-rufipedis]|uniref:CFEM domain-containing protein n=1 Tax=Ophiocordyceps camponoti-rufipedis TaxID=2004952 RepID=A0A2C5Z8A0_9HYPO|nr:hypothetical protein CDD80_1695 [Ophiocordyceps camponoti-rufipedis]